MPLSGGRNWKPVSNPVRNVSSPSDYLRALKYFCPLGV